MTARDQLRRPEAERIVLSQLRRHHPRTVEELRRLRVLAATPGTTDIVVDDLVARGVLVEAADGALVVHWHRVATS